MESSKSSANEIDFDILLENIQTVAGHRDENRDEFSHSSWTQEDIDNDDGLFPVEKVLPNGNLELIFIIIYGSNILEKHCLTGKVLLCLDLKTFESIDEPKVTTDGHVMTQINFKSAVSSKRSVQYVFEERSQVDSFISQHLQPALDRTRKEAQSEQTILECLRCGRRITAESNLDQCPSCNSAAIFPISTAISKQNESVKSTPPIENQSTIGSNRESPIRTGTSKSQTNEDIFSDTWHELTGNRKVYDNNTFTQVDHNVQIVLDVKLFTLNEEFRRAYKCTILRKDDLSSTKEKQQQKSKALLVLSNDRIVLLTREAEKHHDVIFAKPLSYIRFFNSITKQGFWFEWTEEVEYNREEKQDSSSSRRKLRPFYSSISSSSKKSRINYVIVIFGDCEVYENFADYLKHELEIELKSSTRKSSINKSSISTSSPPTSTSSTSSSATSNKSDLNESNLGIFIKHAKTSRDFINDLLIFSKSDNGKIVLAKTLFSRHEIAFQILHEQAIVNIQTPITISSDLKQIKISFMNEFSDDSSSSSSEVSEIKVESKLNSALDNSASDLKVNPIEWHATMYSVNGAITLLNLIKESWEELFAVPLQLIKCNKL